LAPVALTPLRELKESQHVSIPYPHDRVRT
jgi:hypothetical protein